MRRPVKPFVTEYRGGARRQAGVPGQGVRLDQNRPEPDRSEARAPEPWPATVAPQRTLAPPPEDGYEAALRAADALFAARPRKADAALAPAAAAEAELASSETPAPHPAGGRILRAMDERPSEELLRLEAEFAPKRRGRKPGSKNKPKLPAPVVEAAIEAAAEPVAFAPVAFAPSPLRAVDAIAALPATFAAPRAPATAGPRIERYAWVRTKLKPGQQWKRRIPKVAW